LTVEVNKPTPEEQQQLWSESLQEKANDLPQRLSEQFSFSHSEIKRLAYGAQNEETENESVVSLATGEKLWLACRIEARAGMEQLAQRIDVKADWRQLILPQEQNALLQQITDQVAQRNRVYEDWGFREQMNRGLGLNALFAGESGTGKTMAAEVIANALMLDLYRIDLSSVVSKYIGETEKNLRKLFDAAEDSGAILFFDEADALFGKRSEVKDSHDRYANIEINYLLQRMESYRGLAILATNMKGSLDKAFMRRLRFIVDFPFPGAEQRKEIWQKVFPNNTPVEGLDYERLAKLNLTGGSILNTALNAAFLAAEGDKPVTMPLVLNAARTEFKKMERPAKESDFRWLHTTEAK
ncbi:MAG: ATP-binding protein, partial [Proteobacteria bacterium]|nr:ATP-binding protein [Pseudomonadota bacterium]